MSNQIEFRHMRYFQALSRELHFRKAAEKLYISQPGLSRQILQLEEQMGVSLVERDTKNVKLTEAGKYFQQESQFILSTIDHMIQRCQSIDRGDQGEIKIGFVGSAMQNVIPSMIMKSTVDNPDLHFTFEEMRNKQQITCLLSFEIDLAFVRLNKAPLEISIKKIFSDTFSLVVPAEHPIDEISFTSVSDFAQEGFILFKPEYSPAYYQKVLSICIDHGFQPNVVHNSVDASTIYRLVENGLGISIVPTSLREGYDMNIKFIELKDIPQRAELSIAWHKRNRKPALQQVLKVMAEWE